MTDNTAVANRQEFRAPLRTGNQLAAIVPQDAEQAYRMAQMISQSGLAPKGMERPQQIVAAIFAGLEVGLKPLQAVQSIAVVNGRPCVWGDAAVGLVQGSGELVGMREWIEGEGERAVAHCKLVRKGWEDPIERTFSADQAKRAGLWGKPGPWKSYPERMLQMRARSWALRDGFADVLKGLNIREEVRDYHAAVADPADARLVSAQEIMAQAEPEPPAETLIEPPREDAPDPAEEWGTPPDEFEPAAPPPDLPHIRVTLDDDGKPDWLAFCNEFNAAMNTLGADRSEALIEANAAQLGNLKAQAPDLYADLIGATD